MATGISAASQLPPVPSEHLQRFRCTIGRGFIGTSALELLYWIQSAGGLPCTRPLRTSDQWGSL